MALLASLLLAACGEDAPEPATSPAVATSEQPAERAATGSAGASERWLAGDGRWIELRGGARVPLFDRPGGERVAVAGPVSYTHLTLPTILRV